MITWLIDRTIGLVSLRHRQLVEENERLRNQVAELKGEVATLRERARAEQQIELDEKTREVLLYLFQAPLGSWDIDDVAHLLGPITNSEALYYLEILEDHGLAAKGGPGRKSWSLTKEGRRYTIDSGIVAQRT